MMDYDYKSLPTDELTKRISSLKEETEVLLDELNERYKKAEED